MIAAFIPKNEEERDKFEVLRLPEDTRPLGLQNCSLKIIAAEGNGQSRGPISTQLHSARRGFVMARQFLGNMVDIDAHARCLSCFCPDAALFSFDVKSAFTAMFHYWIQSVCRARGLPDGCCNLIDGIY